MRLFIRTGFLFNIELSVTNTIIFNSIFLYRFYFIFYLLGTHFIYYTCYYYENNHKTMHKLEDKNIINLLVTFTVK